MTNKKPNKKAHRRRSILWVLALWCAVMASNRIIKHDLSKTIVGEATTEATIELAFIRFLGMEE
jgi:hypothetical protein